MNRTLFMEERTPTDQLLVYKPMKLSANVRTPGQYMIHAYDYSAKKILPGNIGLFLHAMKPRLQPLCQ
jgi:hypothetical protein